MHSWECEMSALVSIVMPSYNTGRFIAESIRSVMAQTYTNWELIIVDDCSDDDTKTVVDSLCHADEDQHLLSQIRFIRNEKNHGAAYCRNIAIREARGKYIAFLDSDDLWEPQKLSHQVRFMEKAHIHFSYTRYREIDQDGNEVGSVISGPRVIGKAGMFNYCWPGCLTVMYDREFVGEVQIAEIKKNNDYAIWLKVIQKANCVLLRETLASYRKRSGSISRQSKLSLIKWHYRLYREAEGMNPISSLWITLRNLFFGVMKKFLYVGRD